MGASKIKNPENICSGRTSIIEKFYSFVLTLFFLITLSAFTQDNNIKYFMPDNVEVKPVFGSGVFSEKDFLKIYLKQSGDQSLQGQVILRISVSKEGEPVEVTVLNSSNKELNKEALRVGKLIPYFTPAQKDGEPVASYFDMTIPFNSVNDSISEPIKNSGPKNPLYVIDGKVVEEDINLQAEDIKTIRVLKGAAALKLFGQRAKDGVILFETK